MWLLHNKVAVRAGLTSDGVRACDILASDLIDRSAVLMPGVLDRPNGHSLLEVVKVDLVKLGNVNLSDVGHWERFHIWAKRGQHHRPEGALQKWLRQHSLVSPLHGGMWSINGQNCQLGPAIRNFKDFRKGKEDTPHPLIAHFSPVAQRLMSDSKVEFDCNGGWRPGELVQVSRKYKLDELHRQGVLLVACVRYVPVMSIFICAGLTRWYVENKVRHEANFEMRYPHSIHRDFQGRHQVLSVGDDVSVTWLQGPPVDRVSFLTIEKIVCVIEPSDDGSEVLRLLVLPLWYENGDRVTKTRNCTQVVTRAALPAWVPDIGMSHMHGMESVTALSTSLILTQVMVQHQCANGVDVEAILARTKGMAKALRARVHEGLAENVRQRVLFGDSCHHENVCLVCHNTVRHACADGQHERGIRMRHYGSAYEVYGEDAGFFPRWRRIR